MRSNQILGREIAFVLLTQGNFRNVDSKLEAPDHEGSVAFERYRSTDDGEIVEAYVWQTIARPPLHIQVDILTILFAFSA